MAGFSSVTVVGNLVRDVELRYIPSGTAVADVTLAVNEREKKNGEYVDSAAFIDCVLWGKTAELAAEHLSKGSQCLFSGSIRQENWEKDGQKRSKLKINVSTMTFLGSKSDRQATQPAPGTVGGDEVDEDPFGF